MTNNFVDIVEQDEKKAHEIEFVLWPRQWKTYTNLHNWITIPFEDNAKSQIPDVSGIYSFIIKPGIAQHPACAYLMYIGKTKSLRRRFGEYLNHSKTSKGRPKIVRFLIKYSGYLKFCYTTVSTHNIGAIENGLIKAYLPPANDQFPAEIGPAMKAF